jgi:hypothetical protein
VALLVSKTGHIPVKAEITYGDSGSLKFLAAPIIPFWGFPKLSVIIAVFFVIVPSFLP